VRRRTCRVGLTGGIATGKSHVRARFEALGVPTIDADRLAREALAPGSAGLRQVIERFGPGVVDAAGGLDRRALGALVFADPVGRRALEAIVHPVVRQAIADWFLALPASCRLAVADVPLLFESGLDGDYDRVVVTACAPATQLSRVVARDGLSQADAERRVAAQWPLAEKVRRADAVVWTDGTLAETDAQVEQLYATLRAWAEG